MKETFFNPDDIQETITGLKKQDSHGLRSSTNGIPDFVPRRSQDKKRHQAKSTHFIPDIPEQTPSPATNTVFSQVDVDEFLARKPKQYKMTTRDYKELGRNIFLGAGDLISGAIKGSIIAASITPKNKSSNSNNGWGYNSKGQYGYYGSHNWGITFDK
ncbi:hypothetical protein [Salmonella enterica]|uniref:Uncharacterized protein n=1 Tax=Salmonella enterica I TaxID=59201 RepID=A0A8F6T167_SALET|nr:hypothetical protein [Salmonella enterica]PUO62534.1 hypothetical protein DAX55_19470 [Salmonella enterica subsp. enterica]PUQ10918.1 hypothetical protein DAX99_24970 [Salmonella enterica subsp. enterica]QXR78199.1 hypothetical protein DAX88_004240 [Salmonella enterica subsp. enterica]